MVREPHKAATIPYMARMDAALEKQTRHPPVGERLAKAGLVPRLSPARRDGGFWFRPLTPGTNSGRDFGTPYRVCVGTQ
jgi:hypothetical protein